jgi:hypothetical protein
MRMTYPLLLSLILTSSCSVYKVADYKDTSPASIREPSSSVDETNLNTSFDMMMNSDDPETKFVDYLTRQKSIFLRAEANLADFDHELDENARTSNNFSFEDSKTYKKLIVMWGLSHRLTDKIVYHYVKLTEMSYNKSLQKEKRRIAKSILRKFKKKLNSQDPMEKISFDELKSEIVQGNKALYSTDLPEVNFKNEQEKLKVLRQYRDKLREMGNIEQGSTKESNIKLTQEIEINADKLQLVDQSGRIPQSELTFYPSPGPNGNVYGKIFPKNVWALTYDDGPNPTHTPAILKNLEELGIKATFFWLAQNVIRYQSVVNMVKEKGMSLENHSWTHAQLTKLDDTGLQKEIVQSTEVEEKSYGERPKYFRCPYGAGNSVPRIRNMIADLGMLHLTGKIKTPTLLSNVLKSR